MYLKVNNVISASGINAYINKNYKMDYLQFIEIIQLKRCLMMVLF